MRKLLPVLLVIALSACYCNVDIDSSIYVGTGDAGLFDFGGVAGFPDVPYERVEERYGEYVVDDYSGGLVDADLDAGM